MGHHSFLTSELLECSQGILFGENTPKLPAPPLLAFDEIVDIDLEGGKHGRGYAVARRDLSLMSWVFESHFYRDPVMPGTMMIEALLQELEQEAQTTKRVLERVPGDRLAWKPHDRSMSLGQLALHVATVPGNIAEICQRSPFQVPQFTQPAATSAAELVPTLEQSVAKARDILRTMDDASLSKRAVMPCRRSASPVPG